MKSGYQTKRRRDYLTDKEIYEIETAIYNNTLETLYKDVPKTNKGYVSQETIKELTKEEEYIHIPEQEEFILTQSGRVWNTERIATVTPNYSGRDIRIYCKRRKHQYKDLYKHAGWEYNPIDIIKNYKKNNWNISIIEQHKPFFESL